MSHPHYRFVQMQQRQDEEETRPTNVIDKSAYLPSNNNDNGPQLRRGSASLWNPTELRTVPAFYPLEKSSRLVEDDTPTQVAFRLADCLRRLSVQAVYANDGTAHLTSSDHVQMHLSLWRTPNTAHAPGIVVELQRRSGDSIAFHRYARSILDAAMGLLDETNSSCEENTVYSKKVQRLLRRSISGQEHETALQAIEIAHGLLMKDRMDARVLGLESLCLLTDPVKAGSVTAVLTAHVVLLGTTEAVQTTASDEGPFEEIRESILNLVQFSRIGQPDGDDTNDSSLDDDTDDAQHLKLLHHLALAVLANALDVMEHPPTRTRTASSTDVADQFTNTLVPTLVAELGQAAAFPHAATLSAKCLGSLVRASAAARRRAKELGAKQVVQTALDVGQATHLRLETESQKLSRTLANEEEQQQQQNEENDDSES